MDNNAKRVRELTDENTKLRKANTDLFDDVLSQTEAMLRQTLMGLAVGLISGIIITLVVCSLTIGFQMPGGG